MVAPDLLQGCTVPIKLIWSWPRRPTLHVSVATLLVPSAHVQISVTARMAQVDPAALDGDSHSASARTQQIKTAQATVYEANKEGDICAMMFQKICLILRNLESEIFSGWLSLLPAHTRRSRTRRKPHVIHRVMRSEFTGIMQVYVTYTRYRIDLDTFCDMRPKKKPTKLKGVQNRATVCIA